MTDDNLFTDSPPPKQDASLFTDDPAPQNSPMPSSAIQPFQFKGSNPAMMGLSAATQTLGFQPTTAQTPQGQALQTFQNQVMAPARLKETIAQGSAPASQYASNLMKQFGANPVMQAGAGLLAGTAADLTSYAMPGGDVSVTPENLPGARVGEMLSGTKASNLNRAYQGGFYKTYIEPQSLAQSSQEFGDAYTNAVTKHLTPEQQAAMLINPRGEANQKIADVYTQWLQGSPISTQDAVGAKVAIGTVFPTSTAKNASKIARLSEFENDLNGVIAKDPSPEAQAFTQANSNYAASALRSNLSKIMPVNKSNPEEYSKLARYLAEGLGVGGATTGHGALGAIGAAGTLFGTSPLAMGTLAAGAGSLANLADRAAGNPALQAILAKYLENRSNPQGASQ